jgi:hypothetical protein
MPCLPHTPGLVKVPVYLITATFHAQSTGSCMRWRGRPCAVSAVYGTPGLVKVPVYLIIATFLAQSTGSCIRWRGRLCVVSAVYRYGTPGLVKIPVYLCNSHISCSEYWELLEVEGKTMCRVCRVPLDWNNRYRINEHLRSQKHNKNLQQKDFLSENRYRTSVTKN